MTGTLVTGIDIVIPNWNGREMLGTCLSSLQNQIERDFRVIVVDNGSTDGSTDFIREKYPWVTVVPLPENLGFSAAVNQGIMAGNNPWVLLLNNDTEVHPECMLALGRHCHAAGAGDMYALKMCAFADRSMIDGAGDGVLRGGVGYRLGTMEFDGPEFALQRDVFGACAGAALYRRSLFTRIGLFDEDFFAYLEDVDFNMRAVKAGVVCRYLPDAVVYHIGSASTGSKVSDFVIRQSTRNNIFVILKHYSPRLLFMFAPALLVYQLFWLLFVLKKRRFGAYLKGLGQVMTKAPIMIRRRLHGDAVLLTDREFAKRVVASERQVVRSIMSRRAQQGKNNVLLRMYLRIFC